MMPCRCWIWISFFLPLWIFQAVVTANAWCWPRRLWPFCLFSPVRWFVDMDTRSCLLMASPFSLNGINAAVDMTRGSIWLLGTTYFSVFSTTSLFWLLHCQPIFFSFCVLCISLLAIRNAYAYACMHSLESIGRISSFASLQLGTSQVSSSLGLSLYILFCLLFYFSYFTSWHSFSSVL